MANEKNPFARVLEDSAQDNGAADPLSVPEVLAPLPGAVVIEPQAVPEPVNPFQATLRPAGVRTELPDPPADFKRRLRAPEILQFERENPELAELSDLEFFFSPDVAKAMLKNTPGSAFNLLKDVVSIVDPGIGKDARLGTFPALAGIATLAGELQALAGAQIAQLPGVGAAVEFGIPEEILQRRGRVADVARETGIDDFTMLPAVIEFYKQNYGLGPQNVGGFRRYVVEDPLGFLSDAVAISGLMAGTVAKGAKGAQLATQVAAASRLPGAQKVISGLKADRFLVPTERFATKANQFLDAVDPAALPLRGLQFGLRQGVGAVENLTDANLKSAVDQRIVDLEQKYGLTLPASAKSKARKVGLIEAAAVNLGDETLRQLVETAETDLIGILQKTIDDIDGAADMEIAGQAVIDGMEQFKRNYETISRAIYDKFAAEGGLDLPASTDHTFAMLSQSDARRGKALGGIGDVPKFEKILRDLEDFRGEERLPEGAIGQRQQVDVGIDETVDVVRGGRQVRTVFGKDPNVTYRTRYKVVPLDTLIPSQLDSFADNPAFPRELQPRGRDRVAAQQQVISQAAQLQPAALLTDIPALNKGAPIVGKDNLVESGNGRALMLRRARSLHPERFADYQQQLREILPSYGIDPNVVGSMTDPVLVRERITDVDRRQFVRDATEGGLELSPLEKSALDAESLSDDMVGLLRVSPDETLIDALSKPKNNEFITAFSGVLSPQDAAGIAQESGQINRAGVVRIKNALLAKTYTNGLLAQLTESVTPGMRNVEKAMLAALPEMSQVEALVRTGARGEDLGLAQDIEQAVIKAKELRASGTGIDDFFAQGTLIDDDLSEAAKILLPMAEKAFTAPKEFRTFLQRYASEVGKAGNPSQSMIFDFGGPVSKELILAKVAGESFDDVPDISALYDEITGASAAPGTVASAAPVRAMTFDSLKQTRSIIGETIDTDALINSGLNGIYKALYKSLSEDMNNTVKAQRPDLAPLIDEATNTFREGVQLAQHRTSRKFWKMKDSPSLVVPALMRKGTSVEDVRRIQQMVGGVGSEPWREVQAAMMTNLLENSLNQQGNWNPSALMRQLDKGIGKTKLNTIFGSDAAESLHEVAEISASFSRLKKITEGSQTNFLQRLTTSGVLTSLAVIYGGGVPGAAVFASGLVGDKVFRRWIVSDAGQAWLMGAKRVGADRGQRFNHNAALVGRGAFQAGRAARVSTETGRFRQEPQQ